MTPAKFSSSTKEIIDGKIPLDFNWNCEPNRNSPIPKLIPAQPTAEQLKKTIIIDEGLRDGLHNVPRLPKLKDMLRYVEAASQVGISIMTVGIYTGDGATERKTKGLLKIIAQDYPHLSPVVLSLANEESIKWAAEYASINKKIQVIIFRGSSPSRMIAQGWTERFVLDNLAWAVKEAVKKYKLFVIGATEHTTQTPPRFLKKIIEKQVKSGARVFCIADTTGTARPIGAYRIVTFVKNVLKEMGREDIVIDWHGHRDTDNQTFNALMAVAAGANRIHLVPWGIGERSGNTNTEGFTINACQIIKENGHQPQWDLSKLDTYLTTYAEITGNQVPRYGCLGEKSHTTSLGIHAKAILAAEERAEEIKRAGYLRKAKKLSKMARTVYSGIDPHDVGREYDVQIGPYSGKSNVTLWARINKMGRPTEKQIQEILNVADKLQRVLTPDEIGNILEGNNHEDSSSGPHKKPVTELAATTKGLAK